MYLSRGAPLVAPVIVSVVVDHTTARQWGALLSTLHTGLSSEGSQGFLQALPGLLAEILENYFIYSALWISKLLRLQDSHLLLQKAGMKVISSKREKDLFLYDYSWEERDLIILRARLL